MWDSNLGHINFAMHSIGSLQPDNASVPYAPYRTGTKNREFEKTKINKMVTKYIIEPA